MTATPSALTVGGEMELAGTLSAVPGDTSVAGYEVTLGFYDEATCSTEPYDVHSGPTMPTTARTAGP